MRRPIVLEHSNSSVVFDEATILKVFRKVEPGPNPDVGDHPRARRAGLRERAPAAGRAAPRRHRPRRRSATYLVEATEGWDLARTSVRDVLASRLPPEECGGDFAPDVRRAWARPSPACTSPWPTAWGTTPGDPAAWAAEMEAHLDESLVQVQTGPLDVAARPRR